MVTHVTLLDEQLSAQEEFLAEWHSPIMLATPATLSRLAPPSSILIASHALPTQRRRAQRGGKREALGYQAA